MTASGSIGGSVPVALMGLGIGATIGTGLYVQTGFVANEVAGPSIILSFLLAAVGCGFAALCYSELASMVPVAGSAYTYAYATLGELAAWIIGWDLILEYAIASSAVAAGWSNYLARSCRMSFTSRSTLVSARHPGTTTSAMEYSSSRRSPSPTGRPAMAWFNLPAVLDHGSRHGRAGDRRQGKRGLERRDGTAQHRCDSHGRGHRRGLRRTGELAAFLA